MLHTLAPAGGARQSISVCRAHWILRMRVPIRQQTTSTTAAAASPFAAPSMGAPFQVRARLTP